MMDKEFFEIANRLGACRLLHGTENKEELMRLLLTPQGTEFCTKNNLSLIHISEPTRH